MALKGAVQIEFLVVGDGVSTDFSFDLNKDPYTVSPTGNGQVVNWFSTQNKVSTPTSVFHGSFPVSLNGSVVTVTITPAPPDQSSTPVGLLVVF